jgi:hypothetical protein
MANDEMREICGDKWHPDNIWGSGGGSRMLPGGNSGGDDVAARNRTKLFFYWGKNDYWVRNSSRDALIASRARNSERVEFYLDPGEIPHTFCMEDRDMEVVAEKVGGWIGEVI